MTNNPILKSIIKTLVPCKEVSDRAKEGGLNQERLSRVGKI